jgi:hypothetical protein
MIGHSFNTEFLPAFFIDMRYSGVSCHEVLWHVSQKLRLVSRQG